MKYLIAILVMLPMVAAAHSPESCPKLDPPLQFVGKTISIHRGHDVFLGGKEICDASFPGSTVCTSRDLAEGPKPDLVENEIAWVRLFWLDEKHEYSRALVSTNTNTYYAIHKIATLNFPFLRELPCNGVERIACCTLQP